MRWIRVRLRNCSTPREAVAQWRGGKLRPLCVFDKARMPYKEKVTATMSWYDIPPCKDAGLNVEYLMLRGIFMPSGVTEEQKAFYVNLLKKVRETPEWKDYLEKGALNPTTMVGDEYTKWVAHEEDRHKQLMREAGFLAGGK